eukprot:TRINITY_DN51773_c0_g1_i1.p1 TRINITY_DN51773_c0_g1~~TRINITY_DN51773_c0_g1_i1.p1  ORF type:complete len:415 (+),score=26.87 TRINITY_DN51773_c0_g1_i1:123-1367(+)
MLVKLMGMSTASGFSNPGDGDGAPTIKNNKLPPPMKGSTACIKLERKSLDVPPLTNRVKRNPINGEIFLFDLLSFPNFAVVDLCSRPCLPAEKSLLMEDKYLFKPVPMMYRTWIYQMLYGDREFVASGSGSDTDQFIRKAMSYFCLDVPLLGNRWSPLIVYAVIMILSSLTRNPFVVVISIFMGAALAANSFLLNTATNYQIDRFITLPLRLFYMLFVAFLFPRADIIEVVGTCLIILCCLADFFCGDMNYIWTYRYHCSYTILNNIGGRVYVIRRDGGDSILQKFGRGGDVPACVSGLESSWHKHFLLIADIRGLLVELRPMEQSDWNLAYGEYVEHRKPIPYIGLDVFDYDGPPIEAWEDDLEGDWAARVGGPRRAKRATRNIEALGAFRQKSKLSKPKAMQNAGDMQVQDV